MIGRIPRRVLECLLQTAVYITARDRAGELGRVVVELDAEGRLPAPRSYDIPCTRDTVGCVLWGFTDVNGDALVYWDMPSARAGDILRLEYNGIASDEEIDRL